MLNSNTWNHLIVCKQMSFNSFKKIKLPWKYLLTNHIYTYMYKQDLASNNPWGLIWHKKQPNCWYFYKLCYNNRSKKENGLFFNIANELEDIRQEGNTELDFFYFFFKILVDFNQF